MSDILSYKQKTIKKESSISGPGLFTGEDVSITLKPAEKDHGIVFKRMDLPNNPLIFAKLSFVKETPRCTILGDDKAHILTVEHLLSALKAFEIDNVLIEIWGSEVPAVDGGSRSFVDLIEKSGVVEQDGDKKVVVIKSPIYWSSDEIHLVALPSEDFRVSYLLHYPQTEVLRSQYYTTIIDPDIYREEISLCRTFSVYEEIEPLLKKGIIKGGCLNNAVIIKENKVLNPEGLKFPEEMARHKILDLIGDLSLLERKIVGHVIAIRSGHASNVAFAKKILKKIETEEK